MATLLVRALDGLLGTHRWRAMRTSSTDPGRPISSSGPNPGWIVLFGSYSQQFVAFPLFPEAPAQSFLTAADPGELQHSIQEADQRYGRSG
jgi:hypothetical protein